MQLRQLRSDDDLGRWATAMEAAGWDEGNDIDEPYTAESLERYLGDPTNIFVVAHDEQQLLGMASASLRRKPYGDMLWLYVDEVDVAVPHRRKGVGKALMRFLLDLAGALDCDELWLGAEAGNTAAVALYRSLDGDEDEVLGYTFEL